MTTTTASAGSVLLAQLRQQREFWVELDDRQHAGLAVKLRRPTESEMSGFTRQDGQQWTLTCDLAAVQRQAVDWRGFTEAVVLGPAIGAADVVPFHTELWSELVADRGDWAQACRQALIDRIAQHLEQQVADRKN